MHPNIIFFIQTILHVMLQKNEHVSTSHTDFIFWKVFLAPGVLFIYTVESVSVHLAYFPYFEK
jgi:hypothetical protein